MAMSDDSFAMLLAEPFFAGYANRPVSDAFKQSAVPGVPSCRCWKHMDATVIGRLDGSKAPMPLQGPNLHGSARLADLGDHLEQVLHMSRVPC